jgi:hypothetical protein
LAVDKRPQDDPHSSLSAERLKAVLLWSRALQIAMKAVERRFGLNSVWVLVDWHNRAVASIPIRFPNSTIGKS